MGKMLIFHHNDLDGRCAAAIMIQYAKNKGFADIRCIEMDYKDEVPLDDIKDVDTVAVVDFSFKPDVMAEVRKRALNVFWCDHHVTAKEYGYDDLLGFRDFTEKGLAGCECTWKFCFGESLMPRAVTLIGDYDSWRLETAPACFEFYEGMKLQDNDPLSHFWPLILGFNGAQPSSFVDKVMDAGKSAIQYRDIYCADMAKGYGYETEIDGHKAFAMNLYRFGSKSFGSKFEEYPICLAYIHDGAKFTVSLYSQVVDVSGIAKQHGGGGHKGAAGFVCETLPFARR